MARRKGKRGRKDRRRRKRQGEPSVGPTPETKAKLRPDNLVYLWKRHTLTDAQYQAALDIRELMEAQSARYLKSANFEGAPSSRRAGQVHPLDGLPHALFARFHNKYMPWRLAMEKRQVTKGVRLLTLVFEVVANGRGLRDLDAEYRVKRGTCGKLFCEALDSYIATSRPYPQERVHDRPH